MNSFYFFRKRNFTSFRDQDRFSCCGLQCADYALFGFCVTKRSRIPKCGSVTPTIQPSRIIQKLCSDQLTSALLMSHRGDRKNSSRKNRKSRLVFPLISNSDLLHKNSAQIQWSLMLWPNKPISLPTYVNNMVGLPTDAWMNHTPIQSTEIRKLTNPEWKERQTVPRWCLVLV